MSISLITKITSPLYEDLTSIVQETHTLSYIFPHTHMKISHNFRWNTLSQQTLTSYSPILKCHFHQWSAIVYTIVFWPRQVVSQYECLTEFHSLEQISLMMRWSFTQMSLLIMRSLLPRCNCWLSLRPEMAKATYTVAASYLWQWSSQIYP